MGTQLQTRKILSKAMIDRIAFKRGNLSGRYISAYSGNFGILPEDYKAELKAATQDNQVYVVFSFQTPIAWCISNETDKWVIPDVTYSVTTSAHQSLVMVEAHNPGFYLQFH